MTTETPWAVTCPVHGKQYLTGEQYNAQMMAADSLWMCPVCGAPSYWDEDNYEAYYFGDEDGKTQET